MFEFLIFMIAIILGVLTYIKNVYEHWYKPDFSDRVIGFLLGYIVFIVTIFLSYGIGMGIQYKFLGTHEHIVYVKIASLNQNHAKEGNFLLGSGSIKGNEYYLYFSDLGDKKYIRGKVTANKTIIQEGENKNPRLEWTRVEGNTNKFMRGVYVDYKKDYILYIPDNTIIKHFRLE